MYRIRLGIIVTGIIVLMLLSIVNTMVIGAVARDQLDVSSISNMFRPVEMLTINNPIRIVHVNNMDYLYLGYGIYYPIDQLVELAGVNYTYNDKYLVSIDERLLEFKVPIIIKKGVYRDAAQLFKYISMLGGSIDYIYKAFPLISVKMPLENVSKLIVCGLASSIMPDYMVKVSLNESVPMILPDDRLSLLEDEFGRDINGSGIVIGILDTGIDGNHPDFRFPNGTSKIIYNISFVPGESAYDGFGHGTHVAGIAAGTGGASGGVYRGVAYGAALANIKVLSNNGSGYVSWILKGIEYAINESIDIINLSLGGGYNGIGDDPLSIAVDSAFENGVVVVVAAGNEGPNYSSLGRPAVSRKAVTVGAVLKNGTLAEFSSRGPTGDSRVKPDILAPGVNIVAPLAHNSFLEKLFNERYPNRVIKGVGGDYIPLSGTSMAAPHVTGLAALILQVHPNYTPSDVKSVILSTADSLNLDPFTEGLGLTNGVDALNASVAFTDPNLALSAGLGYISVSFGIKELGGYTHKIDVGKVSLIDFYSEPSNLSQYILNIEYPEVVGPYDELSINLSIQIPNLSLYYGFLRLNVDGEYVISAVYTVSALPRVYTNISIDTGYVDGIFLVYDERFPNRVYLPSGYEYLKDGAFRYYAWFNLPPGQYKLFAIGINISDRESNITGPIYLGSKILEIDGGKSAYYVGFSLFGASSTEIPINFGEGINIPYFVIASVELGENKSFSIFVGGTWDIYNDTRAIFSLETNNKIFLNIQYLSIPSIFRGMEYNAIDYLMDYYSFIWVFRSNPDSLNTPDTSQYDIDTSAIRDEEVMFCGLAVFPPHMDYTYISITPLYQGGRYRIHLNKPLQRSNVALVAIDADGFRYRSAVFFEPDSDLTNKVNILSPPYLPTTIVREGVFINGSHYINITSALATSINPTNIIADGYSRQEIYFNGSLIYNSSEVDDFNIHGIIFKRLERGVYRVHSEYNLSYPLYTRVKSTVEFDTTKEYFTPPILYKADLPIILKDGYRISFSFITGGDIRRANVYISWDNGYTWDKLESTISSTTLFPFTLSTVYTSIDKVYEASPSIKIYVEDQFGNKYRATIYNFSVTEYQGYYQPDITMSLDKKIYRPGEGISINISFSGGIYAVPLYVNNSQILNILINGSDSIYLRNVYESGGYGEVPIKIELSYNKLYEAVELYETTYITDAVFRGFLVSQEYFKNYSEGIYNLVVDVGRNVLIGINVSWAHNMSRIYEITLELSNGTQIFLDNGELNLGSRDEPATYNLEISRMYVNINGERMPVVNYTINNLSVIWDQVEIALYPPSLDRIQVNKDISIGGYAKYSLLNEPFNGYIYIDNKKVLVRNGSISFTVSSRDVGPHRISITKIIDTLYNLKSFSYEEKTIYFDDISMHIYGEYSDGYYIVSVELRYLSDNSPVYNAYVYVNGTRAEYSSDGKYVYRFKSDEARYSVIVEVVKEGFDTKTQQILLTREGWPKVSTNIIYITILIAFGLLLAILFIIFLKKKH